MHYLITGHTGFKGSWLSLLLKMQGHTVSGISLAPAQKSLFDEAKLSNIFEHDLRVDIRDLFNLKKSIKNINPEVIIHLAAQPLVRYSYINPRETFETNIMGTINLLESTNELEKLKAVLIVTTDKVYKNVNCLHGYTESNALGGNDPYSASKAAADLAAQSWITNFSTVSITIARAGNVIGGGDWSIDRIIPDLVKSYSLNQTPVIRNPEAIRPWQHVLDCLNGYLMLIDEQIKNSISGEWNFGPDNSEKISVANLVNRFGSAMGVDGSKWELDNSVNPHESNYLLLDSSKARNFLGWSDKLQFGATVDWTANWYLAHKNRDSRSITESQIQEFLGMPIK
jgi:CDP-glucose 4,6-dehydratase